MADRLRKRFQKWFPLADAAGKKFGIDPLLILAVMDRESACGIALLPMGPAGVGDHGFGLGLMQIDHRYHPAFAAEKLADGSPAWADPESNIEYGARILHDNMVAFHNDEFLAVAAYNAGIAAVRQALVGVGDVSRVAKRHAVADEVTTGHNYASDVVDRRTQLRIALVTPEEPTNA